MFNTENKFYNSHTHNHKIDITNCSGGIYKTYKESFFVRWAIDSKIMGNHPEKNYYYDTKDKKFSSFEEATTIKEHVYGTFSVQDKKIELDTNRYKEFVILQMVIISKDYLVCEIILKEDFDKYFGVVGAEEAKENE